MTGFLNINKAEGVSSAYCVNRIKRLTGTPCGHLGTLDPLAGGVLPVAVGNAARLFDYFLSKEKRYRARFRFGWTTETLDRETEPRRMGEVPTASEIEAVLPSFVGEIEQVPPLFSAKCVGGRRGYELARKGEKFELPAKKVHIHSLRLTDAVSPDTYEFEIVCGGGTYIRSLARDLGAALSTGAYMASLLRTASGAFTIETSVPLDVLTPENVGDYLIETDSVLPFLPLNVEDERFYCGVRIPTNERDGVYKIYRGGTFYGTGIAESGVLRADKKLC